MTTARREETIRAEHRRTIRARSVWAAVVPAATLPLVALGPIVGVPLFVLAVVAARSSRRGGLAPLAYGAFHWRLVAAAFRHAVGVQLVAGTLVAAATAAHWARPASVGTAQIAVVLGVALCFSTAYALGSPGDVVSEHRLGLLVERRIGRGVGFEARRLLMKRSEDVDRRAIALFGEPLVSAAVEAMPPFKAALDDPPDEGRLFDRLAALAGSFEGGADSDLADALRRTAAAVETAMAAGVRCRLAAVPPYPTDQAPALKGSVRRYA